MNLPDTTARVTEHTKDDINHCIRQKMEARLFYYAFNSEEIDNRLSELDQEWDIERTLEANASGLSLFGLLMSTKNKKWLVLPFGIASFLMQHALQGWCPPIPIFRRMGIRSSSEINAERYALRLLRGDFNEVDLNQIQSPDEKVRKVLQIVDKK